jgi:hypothetical protein
MTITRSLTLLCAVSFGVSVFADPGKMIPTPIPAGTQLRHISVTVGPDHIGRVDNGVVAQASGERLPIYTEITYNDGFYFPLGFDATGLIPEEWQDALPILAPAHINGYAFIYGDFSGAVSGDTFDADHTWYDGTGNDDAEEYEQGCPALGLILQAVTIVGLPQDGGYYVSVNLAGGGLDFDVAGRVVFGERFYNQSFGAGGSTGPYLAGGNNGVGLGTGVDYAGGNYYLGHGASNSSALMQRLSDGGCYWFGGNPLANFMEEMQGRYGVVGQLSNDYGGLGGVMADGAAWGLNVSGTFGSGGVTVHLASAVGDPTFPDMFTIPVGAAVATVDVQSLAQMGYLSNTVLGIANDLTFSSAPAVFNVVAGDSTSDNAVGIPDLNAVFINFGQVGT